MTRFIDSKGKKKAKKKTKKEVKSKKNNKGKKKSSSRTNEEDFFKTEYDPKSIPKLKTTEKNVLKYIIGQDQQVRQIITAIYRASKFTSIKSNILIIGNSGTGKTATIKRIAEILGLPYTIEDATKYTREGYYGSDVSDMVKNLIENAYEDLEMASHGIIVIDEIDKKAYSGDANDVAGAEVLKSLLKIIEGTTIMVPTSNYFMDDPIPFDTKDLIIIFMGAFPGLDKIRDARLNKNAFGFVSSEPKKEESTHYTKQDLVQYGMPEEFVGRIDTIVEMNNLGKNELARILSESKLSIFGRYERELKKLGITLEYDDDLFMKIANASLELDTGARELSNTVNNMFSQIMYLVLTKPKKYKKCKLLHGIVEDNTRFELS